jgi:hypothetical protein
MAGCSAAAAGAEAGDRKRLSFLVAAIASPTWAHVHAVNFDFVCTADETLPGLTLLPFLLLAGIGVARAVARHRKDR